jgi:ABC-type nitrate/sulfonate/bicarbonate transport system permease component
MTRSAAAVKARAGRDWRDWAYPLALIAILLAAWQAAVMLGWLRPVRFPPPSKLATTFVELVGDGFPGGIVLGSHFAITLQRILLG